MPSNDMAHVFAVPAHRHGLCGGGTAGHYPCRSLSKEVAVKGWKNRLAGWYLRALPVVAALMVFALSAGGVGAQAPTPVPIEVDAAIGEMVNSVSGSFNDNVGIVLTVVGGLFAFALIVRLARKYIKV
jgi:hypothetical protein